MKIKGVRLIALAVMLSLLCGCNVAFFSPENAIHAPSATGIYQGVQAALEQAVGQTVVLKYPLVEDLNTAFCAKDLDGDGKQEMLAFYRLPSEGDVTRMNVIRQVDDEWQSVQAIEPLGSEILHVDFCDLNGDGRDEICVGWRVSTAKSNQMCVYQVEQGRLVQRASESYTNHVICDIDNDRAQELGLALLNAETGTSTISFYKFQNGAFSMIGSLGLDPSVVSYAKITAARVSEQNIGVYLDGYKGTDSTVTELIYFKAGALYNPFAGQKDASNVATLRYCPLTASDVNADGWLDIPFMERLPGHPAGDTDLTHHLICWRPYNEQIGNTAKTWWYNTADGYYLDMDSALQGNYTVLFDEAQQCYMFYACDKKKVGDRLFSIKKFTAAEFEGLTDSAYQTVHSDSVSVWAAAVEPNNSLKITLNSLKKRFQLILK